MKLIKQFYMIFIIGISIDIQKVNICDKIMIIAIIIIMIVDVEDFYIHL